MKKHILSIIALISFLASSFGAYAMEPTATELGSAIPSRTPAADSLASGDPGEELVRRGAITAEQLAAMDLGMRAMRTIASELERMVSSKTDPHEDQIRRIFSQASLVLRGIPEDAARMIALEDAARTIALLHFPEKAPEEPGVVARVWEWLTSFLPECG